MIKLPKLRQIIPARDASIGIRQYTFALITGGFLVLFGIVATPFASLQMFPIPGYMTAFGSSMLVINILLASLLFSRGVTERNSNIIRLGAAYFFVAAIFVPLTASFPGGLLPGSIIGTTTTPVWLWAYWHAGFALGIIRYALGARKPHSRVTPVGITVVAVVAIVIFLALSATVWLPHMPHVFVDQATFFKGNDLVIPYGIIAIDVVALYLVLSLPTNSPEQLWLTIAMIAAIVDVWLTTQGVHRFSLGWYAAKVGSLFTSLAVLLSLFHSVTTLYRSVSERANRDGLTGLYNRRHFDEAIDTEWRRARRDGRPLSFLMIDVDEFKLFNDSYGHLAGDDCLRKIGAVLSCRVHRPADLIARYGGEEFCVLLPNTDTRGAFDLAQAIGKAVRQEQIPHLGCKNGFVTVSIGVATRYPDVTSPYEQLIGAADKALYLAKRNGRDRVEINQQNLNLVA